MRKILTGLAVMGALGVAGCSTAPQLDGVGSEAAKTAPYPKLVAKSAFYQNSGPSRLTGTEGQDLSARAERLRRRGAYLRSLDVIDDATRERYFRWLRRLDG